MKKAFLILGVCIVIVVGFLMFFNKTFFQDYYEVTGDNEKKAQITTLPFSYFVGERESDTEKNTAVFYRFGDQNEMQNQINHYVENLTSCYDDGAFCDTEQDFTIYSYQVSKGFLIHKITLVYDTIDLKEIENATGKDIRTIVQDGEEISMQQGDFYIADEWTTTPEYRMNQTNYNSPATTGRGITTGDTLEKVVLAYSVKPGYALWEVEKKAAEDDSLTIETRKFTEGGFDDANVQKATLILGYYRLEGQFVPLTYEEINQYLLFLSGEDGDKPYDGILLIQFQFPFNGFSPLVGDKTLANYTLAYESGF
jgi:hypothetical protein